MNRGFALIGLLLSVAIIAVLSLHTSFPTRDVDRVREVKTGIEAIEIAGELKKIIENKDNFPLSEGIASNNTCAEFVRDFSVGQKEAMRQRCEEFSSRSCADDAVCGGFPCIENKCFVRPCISHEACPNGLCGLDASPVPGFCTTTNIK